ncbi:hypothetical protein [Bordetella avium]|uniref:Membrane protein n=1 Tax=Bordetella avium (strain 197N) TaxID=360910 RepID=Q2KTQ0_BORA1|nr:hypothetical protein [Bordetella avium]AZY50668.1 hypothetical protein C0J09_17120 [Bordetella avium]AZY54066.1 hypothetical protein C0J07_17375 [Bordetella avium]RIQ15163.1 hypothetical protein D0432_03295 [Bordetella avium]RIQ20040.1 hypothetical protein D0850_02355 [Bordetella avium]RIQ34620.1 hypothetical protein D0849_08340 [Bordetella avium]
MMNQTSPERIRQDSRLIGQTLLKLTFPRLVMRAIVLAVIAVIWLLASSWLLGFGKALAFESLQSMGQQTVDMLNRINPYFWWGVVVIWSLIVFFAARNWLYASMAAGRHQIVPGATLAQLRPQLSEEVVDVLRWVWGDREEPFTVGDLQRSHQELRRNRIGKIALVREQAAILDLQGGRGAAVPTERPDDRANKRPEDRPRFIEPRLGGDR